MSGIKEEQNSQMKEIETNLGHLREFLHIGKLTDTMQLHNHIKHQHDSLMQVNQNYFKHDMDYKIKEIKQQDSSTVIMMNRVDKMIDTVKSPQQKQYLLNQKINWVNRHNKLQQQYMQLEKKKKK